MKCILLKGQSSYDALNCFTGALADALGKLGMHCYIMSLAEAGVESRITELCKEKKIDFILAFNGMGTSLTAFDGRPLMDVLGLPFICFMVDSPAYHTARIYANLRTAIFTFVDREHCRVYEKRYGKKAHFVPHGGCLYRVPKARFSDKADKVLFLGSLVDLNNLVEEQKSVCTENEMAVFRHIIDNMLTGKSYAAALDEIIEPAGFSMDEQIFLYSLFYRADMYVRNVRRINVLRALTSSGIAVTAFGKGFSDAMAFDGKNFRVNGECSFKYAVNKMQEHKLVLNVLPCFFDGAHERIFSAMLSRSVCATDTNPYLDEFLIDRENAILYSHSGLDRLCASVTEVMRDEPLYEHIVENAEKIGRLHTWEQAAEQILKVF